jgi:hypothetical protein
MPFVWKTLSEYAGQKLREAPMPRQLCVASKDPLLSDRENPVEGQYERLANEVVTVLGLLLELTEELKVRALALAKPKKITSDDAPGNLGRNGRPSRRDREFWYQAEREFREAEDLAIHADEDT